MAVMERRVVETCRHTMMEVKEIPVVLMIYERLVVTTTTLLNAKSTMKVNVSASH